MRTFRKDLIVNNRYGKRFKVCKGGVLHESADPGATAERLQTYFSNVPKIGANFHAAVDWIEDIQLLPWDEKGGHAKEPANTMYFGLEMCRPYDGDPEKKEKMIITYNASVSAFARLYHYVYKIDKVTKENTRSHHEVALKWHNTTHVDPTSYLKEIGKDMDMFRAEVQRELNLLRR